VIAFHDPRDFAFVPRLEAAFESILAELASLDDADLAVSPDSLTTVRDGYDETGWRYFDLFGPGDFEANRARCPVTADACAAVPGLVNAGFSSFAPGTHLFPHRGELEGVLRCHLPLIVPEGDQGIRVDGETRAWRRGRCLVFDDTIEHEAWNNSEDPRYILICDVWSPRLSPEERAAIAGIIAATDTFNGTTPSAHV